MELSIPLPRTPEGRIYRYSPNEKALPRHFVLGDFDKDLVVSDDARKRMKLPPRSKQTVCPYSGTIADDQDFTHPHDVKAATNLVGHAAMADVQDAIHGMFRDLERKFSSSKFMSIKVGPRAAPKPRPRFARRDLLRELVCDHCGRDYGVFAIGLFCPDCGAPNLRLHFAREAQIVAQQIELADAQEGREELGYRLMGNAHEDVLTAFEATLKAVYLYGMDQLGARASEPKPVRNDFQNVENAQRRFSELTLDPFSILSQDELSALKLNIQKRHIIGHNLGVMDKRFSDHAADARIGETVHIIGEDIRRFAALAQRVVDGLNTWLVGGMPAPVLRPVQDAGVSQEEYMSSTSHSKGSQHQLDISPLAIRVGTWLVTQSQDGLAGPVRENITAAFAGVNDRDLVEAIAELASDGYLRTTATMGGRLPRISTNLDLFATFDPIANIGDPVTDSLSLVETVLQGDDSVNVADLHKQSGWAVRRFNPAVGLVIAQVDERRVSGEIQSQYPSRYFTISADDRVALKRYVANLSR
jgi:hypothetical protein